MTSNRKHVWTLLLAAASGTPPCRRGLAAARLFTTTPSGLQALPSAPATLRRLRAASEARRTQRHIPNEEIAELFNRVIFSDSDLNKLLDRQSRAWPAIYPVLFKLVKRTVPSADVDRNVAFFLDYWTYFDTAAWGAAQLQLAFEGSAKAFRVKIEDVAEVARVVFGAVKDHPFELVALSLMQRCAEHGYLHACLDLGSATLNKSARRQSANMKADNSIALHAIQLLRKFADKGNVLAATRLAEYSLHDGTASSLNLWDRAIALAKTTMDEGFSTATPMRFQHLQKPWILAAEHLRGKLDAKANQYLRMGMQLDDADAYAAYAEQNSEDEEGDDLVFLEWLNAATKAAASGSVQSAISLSKHYANRAACDPVDILKLDPPGPSPFKRVCERLHSALLRLTSSSRYSERLAFLEKRDESRANEDSLRAAARVKMAKGGEIGTSQIALAEFDASCKTPVERMAMAIHWLELAVEYRSLPAALELAFLHSRRYVFQEGTMYLSIKHPDEQTDSDILEMTREYPEVFGEDPKLEEPWNYTSDGFPPAKNDDGKRIVRKGTENPFYDPKQAALYLEAVARGHAVIEAMNKRGIKSRVDKLLVNEFWYLFPDTARHNEKVSKRCWEKAKRYADVLGVDMDIWDGGQHIKHTHNGRRGSGIAEIKDV